MEIGRAADWKLPKVEWDQCPDPLFGRDKWSRSLIRLNRYLSLCRSTLTLTVLPPLSPSNQPRTEKHHVLHKNKTGDCIGTGFGAPIPFGLESASNVRTRTRNGKKRDCIGRVRP